MIRIMLGFVVRTEQTRSRFTSLFIERDLYKAINMSCEFRLQ